MTRPGTRDVGDGDRVVDRRPVPAVALVVEPRVEPQQVGEHVRDRRAERVQPGDVGVEEQRRVGHVEADHRDRQAAAEHDPGRLRVHPDVELGRGRPVPLAHRAAHQADVGDLRCQAGRGEQQLGDVGQRPGRDQGDRAGRGLERRAQEREGALGPELGRAAPGGPRRRGRSRRARRRRSRAAAGAAPPRRPPPGTSVRPSSARTRSVLRVVSRRPTLPATVVMPRTSSSGRARASVIASASSWPGSQSSRTGMRAVTGGSRRRRSAASRIARRR